ncbi:MAG: hypothetical protein DI626_03770, partial [Micavibrio aeruginosavorus]
MTSGNFSKLYNFSSSLLTLAVAGAALVMPCAVFAQSEGYTPPPMFGDMTPPMVRPETATGNLVEPKRSERMEIAPSQAARPPVVVPRTSAGNANAAPAPVVTPESQPPALPAPAVESMPTMAAPTTMAPAPKMMQPIIEETQPRRAKPVKEAKPAAVSAPKEEERTAAPTPRRKPDAAPKKEKAEAAKAVSAP